MNDLTLNWKKISCGIPYGRHAPNDRAPTLEELRKLAEYPDRRIKPIVSLMVSTGIRIGTFDYIQRKHIIPIYNNDGNEVIATKLIAYPVDSEEYCALMTPADAAAGLKPAQNQTNASGLKPAQNQTK